MAGVAKHLKGFPVRYGVEVAGSTAVNAYESTFESIIFKIVQWDAISGCRFRLTQIEDLNRRDPVPGSAEPGIRGKFSWIQFTLPRPARGK